MEIYGAQRRNDDAFSAFERNLRRVSCEETNDYFSNLPGVAPTGARFRRRAFQGKSLASVTVVGNPDCSDGELEARVRAHLTEWFDGEGGAGKSGVRTRGADVAKWKYLRTYRVPYAQPAQTPPVRDGGFYGRKIQVRVKYHVLRAKNCFQIKYICKCVALKRVDTNGKTRFRMKWTKPQPDNLSTNSRFKFTPPAYQAQRCHLCVLPKVNVSCGCRSSIFFHVQFLKSGGGRNFCVR